MPAPTQLALPLLGGEGTNLPCPHARRPPRGIGTPARCIRYSDHPAGEHASFTGVGTQIVEWDDREAVEPWL